MSLSSSSEAEGQLSRPEAAPRHPSSLGRRLLLTVWLPVWVAVGFYLSQGLLVASIIALRLAGISFAGVNVAILNTAMAALVYLLTAIIVIGLPWVVKKSRTRVAELGLGRLPAWQDMLLAPAGFVIYLLGASALASLATRFLPGFDPQQVQEIGFEQIGRPYEYILAFVTLVVIAPVAEEVLMRGYLYGKLRKIVPVAVAMIVTAALFAVLHLQWNVAIDVFALSLVLTSLREVSGSIWASILLHMMKNGLAFYLLFINPALSRTIGG